MLTGIIKRLKDIANEKGIKQVDIAKRLKTTDVTVSRWFNGKRSPKIADVEKLADVLDYRLVIVPKDHYPLTEKEVIDNIAREDSHMLLRRFVASVGYDYVRHHKKHVSQIHPDWSNDTHLYWQELDSRLNETTTLNFDRKGALEELMDNIQTQSDLCKRADYTSSYHYGLKSAYSDAIRIIENHTTKGDSNDD